MPDYEPGESRTTRCLGCGDLIDIDPDGYQSLCSCDATE